MKLDVLLLISAFALAFVHPNAAQVAATAVLVLLTVRIERGRRARKKKSAPVVHRGARSRRLG
jgi:hypothetical protein